MKTMMIFICTLLLYFIASNLVEGRQAGPKPDEAHRVSQANASIPKLRDTLRELESEQKTLLAERKKREARLIALKETIKQDKIDFQKNDNFFKYFMLSDKLKKARTLAEEMIRLEEKIADIDERLKDVKDELADQLAKEVKRLRQEAIQSAQSGNLETAQHLVDEATRLHTEEKRLEATLSKPAAKYRRFLHFRVKAEDHPKQVREKIMLIRDDIDLIEQRQGEIDQQLDSFRKEIEFNETILDFFEEAQDTPNNVSVVKKLHREIKVTSEKAESLQSEKQTLASIAEQLESRSKLLEERVAKNGNSP